MIKKCIVVAPAKINLSLDIIGRREDGYHLLETIMQTIDLYDRIEVTVLFGDNLSELPAIIITSSSPVVPTDLENTAARAAKTFFEKALNKESKVCGTVREVRIFIHKGIPQEAGLAGGSADAAGTLVALDYIFPSIFTSRELIAIAAEIGADVPFCLIGGTALCTGIGDIVSPLPDFGGRPIVLVKPAFGISTPWAFQQFDRTSVISRPDTAAVLAALEAGSVENLVNNTANALEEIATTRYPLIGQIRESLQSAAGCCGAMMSGSGPSVFAIFDEQSAAHYAAVTMQEHYLQDHLMVKVTKTINTRPTVISDTEGEK